MFKKNISRIVTISLAFILLSAMATFALDFKDWGERESVTVDKAWTITFDMEMQESSINEENIYILNDETNEKHPVTLELSPDQKAVKVTPVEDYQFDTNYTLYITTDVKGKNGKNLFEAIKKTFVTSLNYKVATMNSLTDFTVHETYRKYDEAYSNVEKDGSQVIILGDDNVVWALDGIVRTKGYTIIYESPELQDSKTYVNNEDQRSVELEYVETLSNAIEIKVAGTTGYISHFDATIIPNDFLEHRSYYKVIPADDGSEYLLYHYIYNGEIYRNYLYGWAPDWLEEDVHYYSWDGITFEGKEHKLFNQLNLNLETNYTAEELDSYIENNSPKLNGQAPLAGLGATFKEAEKTYHVNALFLMSLAIHESNWGGSRLAQEKNNLFGLNAHDEDPFGMGDEFNSFEDSILHAAKFVQDHYLNPRDWRYNGPFTGNKAFGLNVRYASDPYWGQKVAGHMYRADTYLGGNDRELIE